MKRDPLIRAELSTLMPYNSGLSIADIQQRYNVDKIAKLGSNENPFGPAPEVMTAIERAARDIRLYPESQAGVLREQVAEHFKIDPDYLIFGNGSEDILSIICRTIVNPGDRVVTLYPSFPLHEDYVVIMGGKIERVTIQEDLNIDVDALINAVQKPAKMVLFANPMNPVGSWLSTSDLKKVISNVHPDTLLVLDEAYFEYAQSGDYCTGLEFLKPDHGNWMVLRTFSKAWGLAGLRAGFAVCSSSALREALDLTRTPFNVNSMAQFAAAAAIQNDGYMMEKVALIIEERTKLKANLVQLGCNIAPSLGNFLFVDAGRPSGQVADALLKDGVIVKPWKQAGFETFFRVSIGTSESNQQFLRSIKIAIFGN